MASTSTRNTRLGPTGAEQAVPVFDRATRLARTLFGAVEAKVTLITEAGLWRSRSQPEGGEAQGVREVMRSGQPLWVENGAADPRFRDDPVVVGPPYVRFFAGAPIRLEDGSTPGALWVAGLEPRPYDRSLANRLQDLADFVADEWARERARRGREVYERTLSAVVDAMPISLVLADRQMRVIYASPTWISARGLDHQRVVGERLYDLRPEIFRPWRERFELAIAGQRQSFDRVRLERSDGGVDYVKVELAPWRTGDGEVGGVIVASYDISSMVEALERTERSEERLKLALEIAEVHVYEMDYVRHELIKVGAEDTFFEKPKTYRDLAKDIWATIDPRDRPHVMAAWDRHLERGAPYRPEYRLIRTDGQEVWASGTAKLITDESGRPIRLVGALQNITDRKTAERTLLRAVEAAEAATRAKSAFLATMSHEIRTPLNGVLGMAQAMAADADLSETQRKRLDVIHQSGESLLAILNDVLDLSKIEAGKLELEQAPFEVSELATAVHATFQAIADAKGLTFELSVDRGARGVYEGDPVRVRQILWNLVSNALKFTERGGVKVRIGRENDALSLTVFDSGIGMSAEALAGLFRKFEQADASTTRRFGGTGLGLAICRELAELMGGSIHATSAPGMGATFTAVLPLPKLAQAAPKPKRRRAAPRPQGGAEAAPIRVLAAEDNSMNQLVLRTLLAQVGIEPTIVENGRHAVEAWEREAWDVILMDVQMPVMDGPTATALIRTRERTEGRRRTPIVALTANAMAHQISEYMQSGMDAFVAKPIEAHRLFEALEAAVNSQERDTAAA